MEEKDLQSTWERISRRVSFFFFLRLIVTRDYAWLGRERERESSEKVRLFFLFISFSCHGTLSKAAQNFSFSLQSLPQHIFSFFLSFSVILFFLSPLPQQIIRVQGSSRRWRRSSGFPFSGGCGPGSSSFYHPSNLVYFSAAKAHGFIIPQHAHDCSTWTIIHWRRQGRHQGRSAPFIKPLSHQQQQQRVRRGNENKYIYRR